MQIIFKIYLLSAFLLSTVSAQESATVVNFYASIGDDVLNQLDTYAPTTIREKENFSSAKNYLNHLFNHRVFSKVENHLRASREIHLAPIGSLESFGVVYNDLGYPIPLVVKGAIKKATKRGHDGGPYLSITVFCSDVATLGSAAKLTKQSKPQVKITINQFDTEGTKVSKAEGKVKARKAIKAKDFSPKFDKMEEGSMDDLLEKVIELADQAILEAVEKL